MRLSSKLLTLAVSYMDMDTMIHLHPPRVHTNLVCQVGEVNAFLSLAFLT
jgi:hypothetical protein